MQNNKLTPKYVRYLINMLQETKITQTKQISKMTKKLKNNRPFHNKLSLNMEPKVNDVQSKS